MAKSRGPVILLLANEEERKRFSSFLGRSGFEPRALRFLSELALFLNECDPFAIISDMILPDGSGLNVFRLLLESNKSIPVIFITDISDANDVKRVFKAGAYDCLVRPIEPADIADVLNELLRSVASYDGPERRKIFLGGDAGALFPSMRDELTGLASHRYVVEKLVEVYQRCMRLSVPLSICLIDIDGFRRFNNTFGLDMGDLLLIEVGKFIKRCVRRDDIVGRYGSDEFLLLLPGAKEADAYKVAEKIISRFKDSPPVILGRPVADVALCIGLAEAKCYEPAGAYEFLDRATEAIYHARLRGPWSLVIWSPSLSRELFDTAKVRSDIVMLDFDAINVMMWRFRELSKRLTSISLEALRVLVAAVEARDPYTKHHSLRVATLSRHIAEEIGLRNSDVQVIHSAAMLHDIGKIGIPDRILTKQGTLTAAELELIRQHPVIGVNILEQTTLFDAELPYIKHHHEHYDGSGYPDGLRGEDIPIGSRIICIADAIEAMLARRSYKGSYNLNYVLSELEAERTRQFDPEIVDVVIRVIKQDGLANIWTGELYDEYLETLSVPLS